MAFYYDEPAHTFSEYLLVPGYSSSECVPANVDLRTPLVKFKKGEEPAITMNIPLVSAIMQSVSDDKMAVALSKEGGISFIYGSQSIEDEAAMVERVKTHRAGFVSSDSNIRPDSTLADIIALKEKTGHSTVAVTSDGTVNGKLEGIVTSRDYRVSRMDLNTKVKEFMTPISEMITAPAETTLQEANDIIWENKLNTLPIIDDEGRLLYMVFRKDYATHKEYPLELLDSKKRHIVGAGINTRDYAERVPALVNAGVDVLCIDSSEGYSEWQKITLAWIREHYGDSVKVGAGNVVDAAGFRFLAECGADFVKVGIGGGSICITREQKGIGRGQATAVIEVAKARDEYYKETGIYVPICSDGGIVYDYHMTLALAMGADFLMLSTLVVIAVLLYRGHKSRKMAVLGCAAGSVAMACVGMLTNYFLIIPFYSQVMPLQAIFDACNAINPYVTGMQGYLLLGVLPFNLIKGAILTAITMLAYKKLSVFIKSKQIELHHSRQRVG
mgnify:CR=1 FL=1